MNRIKQSALYLTPTGLPTISAPSRAPSRPHPTHFNPSAFPNTSSITLASTSGANWTWRARSWQSRSGQSRGEDLRFIRTGLGPRGQDAALIFAPLPTKHNRVESRSPIRAFYSNSPVFPACVRHDGQQHRLDLRLRLCSEEEGRYLWEKEGRDNEAGSSQACRIGPSNSVILHQVPAGVPRTPSPGAPWQLCQGEATRQPQRCFRSAPEAF